MRSIKIEVEDERNEMIRDKSGRLTLRIMSWLYIVSIAIFSIISMLGKFEPYSKCLIYAFSFILIFQYVCEAITLYYISNRI